MEGEMPSTEGVPLSELRVGQGGVLARIRDVNSLLLAYLEERSIKPSVRVRVLEIAPFNGPQTVAVDQNQHVLGTEVAAHLIIELEEASA
jgi:DtxR family Mn-dependent transcriptional regulator